MTIADANCPAHCNISCDKCVQESEQLVEWLEDYQQIKMLVPLEQALKAEYNKAIDDFAEKAIKIVYEANNRDRNPQPRDMVADIHYKLLEIAEQLKAGGENDNI